MDKKAIIFFSLFSIVFGQISMSDINKLSNAQLDAIKKELQSKSATSVSEVDVSVQPTAVSSVKIESKTPLPSSDYFGYSYFQRDINFFDNIPTPSNFKLGPGDEIILSLWGETNSRENFIINKEGLIYYQNIGFINLSNKTIEQAELLLTNELSAIYSTLKEKNNSTNLKIELGKLKSINVYFTGQINTPGISLIHPFSDVFSAIVQAGGIKNDGSLRNVQLIRDGKTISMFDFYSLFIKGENTFSEIRILDGDIIHIPVISNRVHIRGSVYNPGWFEPLNNESLLDMITYAGGLKSDASSSAVINILLPIDSRSSDDNARKTKNISLKEFSNISLNNGDSINILSIGNVETTIEILGRVKSPGNYAPSSLKNVLDIAGGFNDPLYRKTIRDDEITVIRKDENQFYGLEFEIPYNKSDSFQLMSGDKVFVYENTMYNNLFSISVTGAVNKRGSFQLKSGMTVQDAIDLAEGFSPLANEEAITVTEIFTSVDDLGNVIEEKNQVNDATLDFELTNGSVINVLPLENVVNVEGNIYNPGLITYTRGKTVNKYINLAGGPKPNTLSTKIYVKRANGRIKKVTLFQGIGTIVRPGDTIFVPVDPDPQDFDITSFISDIATTLANIAAILIIVDNQDD
tara:strand:+ start:2131 stop:4032 length:1902 start_codon:yes stop_codon:yes gene_type:complete